MLRRCLISLSLSLPLALAGCPPAHVERPYPAPTAEQLVAAVDAHNHAVRSLRARTKMDHFDQEAGQRVKGEVLLLVELPDHLHFHAVSPLGTPLATLASDGSHFELHDAQKNRFLTGPATACNVGRFTGIAMPPADAATILVAGMPLIDHTRADDTWDDLRGAEVLTLRAADGTTETLTLGGPDRDWDVLDATIQDARGRTLLAVKNEHFHDVDGVRLPSKTKIEEPWRHADLLIDWKSQEVDPTLPASAFALTPPPGVAPEEATCGEAPPASAPTSSLAGDGSSTPASTPASGPTAATAP